MLVAFPEWGILAVAERKDVLGCGKNIVQTY